MDVEGGRGGVALSKSLHPRGGLIRGYAPIIGRLHNLAELPHGDLLWLVFQTFLEDLHRGGAEGSQSLVDIEVLLPGLLPIVCDQLLECWVPLVDVDGCHRVARDGTALLGPLALGDEPREGVVGEAELFDHADRRARAILRALAGAQDVLGGQVADVGRLLWRWGAKAEFVQQSFSLSHSKTSLLDRSVVCGSLCHPSVVRQTVFRR